MPVLAGTSVSKNPDCFCRNAILDSISVPSTERHYSIYLYLFTLGEQWKDNLHWEQEMGSRFENRKLNIHMSPEKAD